jgi:hypothetical protein
MRKAGFLAVFVLTHALLTHATLLRAYETQAAGWRVAAATLSMPLLLPLIQFDPDGDRLPTWFQLASFPLNSAIWAAGIAIIATAVRRRRSQHRGFEVRPRDATNPPPGI